MNIRVICIDNKNPANPDRINLHHIIYEGEVYHVIDITTNTRGVFYSLAERDFGSDSAIYNAKRFIALSEIDEMEYYKQYCVTSVSLN